MKVQTARWGARAVLVLLLLVLFLNTTALSAQDRAGSGPRVSVWPVEQELLVGHSGLVELRIDDVQDLYAVELHLTYDPTVLDLLDASGDPGVQIGAGNIFQGLGWYVDINTVDEITGAIDYVFSLDANCMGGVSGSGVLARIDFTALQLGTSPLLYTEVVLARRNGESITHTVANGSVRVVVVPSTATSTPSGWVSPTATATPNAPVTSTPVGPIPTWTAGVPSATATPTLTPSLTPTPWSTPRVYIVPAEQTLLPGTAGALDIQIDNAPGIYGAWVRLSYAPGILNILDADDRPGIQIEPGDLFEGQAWYEVANEVNTGAGTITYGCKLSFNEPSFSRDGRLARINVQALNLGDCPFAWVEVILTDREGVSFNTTEEDGLVHVALHLPTPVPPTATPTATSTPGPAATATPTATSTPLPTPVLYLHPEAASLAVAGETEIEVWVDHVSNLYAAEFHIDYDPAIIEVLDEDAGRAGIQIGFGPFLAPDSVVQNQVDESAGLIHFVLSQTSPSPARHGSGIIARFRVRALSEGASALAFQNTELTDVFAHAIVHGRAGGLVAVNARVVVGHLYLQGRAQHGGIQVWRGDELLATTGQDGSFVLACPVGVGEALSLQGLFTGYLPVTKTVTVPVDPVVDLGEATLLGGDVVGPGEDVPRATGCPGEPTATRPNDPDLNINIVDLTFVGGSFGVSLGDPRWEPSPDGCHPEWISSRADVNGDSRCNIFDLVQVGNNFGASGYQPW